MELVTWQISASFWKGFFTPMIWFWVGIGIIIAIAMKFIFGKIEKAIERKRKKF